jgi:Rrf2 family protein
MISKTGLHAVKALALLSGLKKGEFLGAAAIAEQIGAPKNYLGKLLQALAKEGLVEGQKGMNGGFRLGKSNKSISLLEVIEPIDKVSRWRGCFLGNSKCSPKNPCRAHRRWEKVRDSYLDFLLETSIADIGDA